MQSCQTHSFYSPSAPDREGLQVVGTMPSTPSLPLRPRQRYSLNISSRAFRSESVGPGPCFLHYRCLPLPALAIIRRSCVNSRSTCSLVTAVCYFLFGLPCSRDSWLFVTACIPSNLSTSSSRTDGPQLPVPVVGDLRTLRFSLSDTGSCMLPRMRFQAIHQDSTS